MLEDVELVIPSRSALRPGNSYFYQIRFEYSEVYQLGESEKTFRLDDRQDIESVDACLRGRFNRISMRRMTLSRLRQCRNRDHKTNRRTSTGLECNVK